MPTADQLTITMTRRLPLAAALRFGALLAPTTILVLFSSIALNGGRSVGGATVLFLFAQPVMLVAAATMDFLCYRRFTNWRFATALGLPVLSLLCMGFLF